MFDTKYYGADVQDLLDALAVQDEHGLTPALTASLFRDWKEATDVSFLTFADLPKDGIDSRTFAEYVSDWHKSIGRR